MACGNSMSMACVHNAHAEAESAVKPHQSDSESEGFDLLLGHPTTVGMTTRAEPKNSCPPRSRGALRKHVTATASPQRPPHEKPWGGGLY